MRFVLIFMMLSLSACASQDSQISGSGSKLPGLGASHSTQMTAQECQQAGGIVVGDIGDGRIHSSDYLCKNGEMPLGSIVPKAGEPIATEGAVCCGSE